MATGVARLLAALNSPLRYVLLCGWGLIWFFPAFDKTIKVINDWLVFEIGARILVHYHSELVWSSTPALHLYADNPHLQVGPPSFLLLALFQAFSPRVVATGFGIFMLIMGACAVAALEACASTLAPRLRSGRFALTVFAMELALIAAWAREDGYWHHLDDALALFLISLAMWRCASRRSSWWSVGLLAGTAMACKPWAVVALPLLFGLPRAARAKAFLAALAAGAVWWLPFVFAAPDTVYALGTYHINPSPGSVLSLFLPHSPDVSSWLRPVQFSIALLVACLVAVRGRWAAAPLGGFAARTIFDPFAYSYYSLGPLIGAFVWDLTRSRRPLPVWTAFTLIIEYAVPAFGSAQLAAASRLAWAVAAIGALLIGRPAQAYTRPLPRTMQHVWLSE